MVVLFYFAISSSKSYKIYQETYKKEAKKHKMFGKMRSAFQYSEFVKTKYEDGSEATLKQLSKQLVDIDSYQYTREEGKRLQKKLTRNVKYMAGKEEYQVPLTEVRQGRFDDVIAAVDLDISDYYRMRRGNGASSYEVKGEIARLYYGSD